MPVSTPPGPSSAKLVTPASSSVEQAVLPAHGARQLRREQARPVVAAVVGHRIDVRHDRNVGVARAWPAASASRRRSRAGAMNGVWKAPDTWSGMTFLAPSSLAWTAAASTPAGDPAITIWPGALKFATQTSASARRQAISTWSSSRPRTAAIVPGWALPASCMAAARATTRRTPSSKPEGAGGGERGVLAEAVAGAEARLDAETLDRVEHHQARHERGELGVAGVAEFLRIGVAQQLGDVASGHVARLVDQLPALVIAPRQTHARSLRPLTGEGEGEHPRQARPTDGDEASYRPVADRARLPGFAVTPSAHHRSMYVRHHRRSSTRCLPLAARRHAQAADRPHGRSRRRNGSHVDRQRRGSTPRRRSMYRR